MASSFFNPIAGAGTTDTTSQIYNADILNNVLADETEDETVKVIVTDQNSVFNMVATIIIIIMVMIIIACLIYYSISNSDKTMVYTTYKTTPVNITTVGPAEKDAQMDVLGFTSKQMQVESQPFESSDLQNIFNKLQ